MNKALLVGINAYQSAPLKGCINDVLLMQELLVSKYGFGDPRNRRVLTDASATTANIMERLEWLVDGAQPGDVLFFHFSGHGSQIADIDYDTNDEPDGLDEVICPVDLDWRTRIIKDDDFKRIFNRVPDGVNLTVLLDCCHSGSGLRNFGPPPDLLPGSIRPSFGVEIPLESPNASRYIPTPVDIANRSVGLDLQPKPRALIANPQIVPVEQQHGILISGCKSNQTSADAYIHPRYNGACTYFLAQTLADRGFTVPYGALVDEMNERLTRAGYEQKPELNCASRFFNVGFLQPLV